MDVSEPGRDAEVGRDLDKSLVDLPDVLRLGVEGVVVDILVVDTILLAASDANLHLEPLLPGGGTLKVLGRGLDIVLNILLRKIDHVAAEEGNTSLLEEGLVGVHHPVEPGKKLLGAVVAVKDHGNAIRAGYGANVVCAGDGASNRRSLVGAIGNALESPRQHQPTVPCI